MKKTNVLLKFDATAANFVRAFIKWCEMPETLWRSYAYAIVYAWEHMDKVQHREAICYYYMRTHRDLMFELSWAKAAAAQEMS